MDELFKRLENTTQRRLDECDLDATISRITEHDRELKVSYRHKQPKKDVDRIKDCLDTPFHYNGHKVTLKTRMEMANSVVFTVTIE